MKLSIIQDAFNGTGTSDYSANPSFEKFFVAIESQEDAYHAKLEKVRQKQEHDKLHRDYIRTAGFLTALEAIQQVVIQGKNFKRGAPDGSQDINFLEKMAAKITGWLGLSDTGMGLESLSGVLDEHTRHELFVKSLDRRVKAVKKAMEDLREDLDNDVVEEAQTLAQEQLTRLQKVLDNTF